AAGTRENHELKLKAEMAGGGRWPRHLPRRGERCPCRTDFPAAGAYAGQRRLANTAHLQASVRRAANRLVEQGLIQSGKVRVETRWEEGGRLPSQRQMLCVAAALPADLMRLPAPAPPRPASAAA